MPDGVKWPGGAYDPGGEDLSQPLKTLLVNLNLQEKDEELNNRTPLKDLFRTLPSLQVITSGASSLAKSWTVIVGALGIGGSGWAWIKGVTGTEDSAQRVVLTASAAVFLAATVVAIAIMVRADISARAAATAAEYQARAAVVAAVTSAFQTGAVPALPRYWVRRRDGAGDVDQTWYPVVSFKHEDGELLTVIRCAGADQPLSVENIAEWTPTQN